MIWYYLILFITSILNVTFSWLPKVETLPIIMGVDVDAQLLAGMGLINRLSELFWMMGDLITAAKIMLGYYVIKMVLGFFLGSRSPGSK
jgi:hypothetical protein